MQLLPDIVAHFVIRTMYLYRIPGLDDGDLHGAIRIHYGMSGIIMESSGTIMDIMESIGIIMGYQRPSGIFMESLSIMWSHHGVIVE